MMRGVHVVQVKDTDEPNEGAGRAPGRDTQPASRPQQCVWATRPHREKDRQWKALSRDKFFIFKSYEVQILST